MVPLFGTGATGMFPKSVVIQFSATKGKSIVYASRDATLIVIANWHWSSLVVDGVQIVFFPEPITDFFSIFLECTLYLKDEISIYIRYITPLTKCKP